MRIVADLHIHSKYARAVSRDMVLEELDRWADDKGITVMGTGDFTHPSWLKELETKLEPAEPGLFKLKSSLQQKTIKGTIAQTRFMLTTEVSSIYSRGGRSRRVHNLIFAPDFTTVSKINTALARVGNLKSDGRPIIGIDAEDLLKIVLDANSQAVLVPAHAWTPWFAIFGSMSGFETIEECFGDYAKYIFAIETGLSSDPPMNWRLSSLDRVALISNSDSHSLQRIGREANILETQLSFTGIIEAIRNSSALAGKSRIANSKSLNGGASCIIETIEFYPEEGRYHVDGHRLCGIVWTPEQTERHKGICPKCGQQVTRGTLGRIQTLADRPKGYVDPYRPGYRRLVPLDEIIGEAIELGPKTKGVLKIYEKMIRLFQSEIAILTAVAPQDIAVAVGIEVAEGVRRVREGKLEITPGYDGEYGHIKIFSARDRKRMGDQKALF